MALRVIAMNFCSKARIWCLGYVFVLSAIGAFSVCSSHGQVVTEQDFPVAVSKKGLQVEDVADAIELGIKHAAVNLNLCQLLDLDGQADSFVWNSSGKDYYFRRAYVEQLEQQIRPLSEQRILVYAILLCYKSSDERINRLLIHPNCDENAPNRLGAFNTAEGSDTSWLRASVEFLAQHFSKAQSGKISGWIVGNEVNSHWWWSNMGRVTQSQFIDNYERALRLVHASVRSQSAASRIYVSLEHHWSIRYPAGDEYQAFPAQSFLQELNELTKHRGDFDWHIAFHPYPENLFDPIFWEDESALATDDSPRVTFRNLEVLLRFLGQPSMRFGGQSRRVILSEQGFHSADGEVGETEQAAAYCYAYRLMERLPGIDAFILHRHIDHPREGGLNLGLRKRVEADDGFETRYPRKKIYEVFRAADTEQWQDAFQFALPIVGLKEWPGS